MQRGKKIQDRKRLFMLFFQMCFFLSKKYYHAVRHVAVVDNAKIESRQKLTAATTRSNRSHLSSVTAVTNQNQLLTSLNNNDSVHNSIHERNRRWHPVNVIHSRLCSAFFNDLHKSFNGFDNNFLRKKFLLTYRSL